MKCTVLEIRVVSEEFSHYYIIKMIDDNSVFTVLCFTSASWGVASSRTQALNLS